MRVYDVFDFISLVIPLIAVYLLFCVIFLGIRYLKIYSKDKKLKFTQEEIRQRRKDIADLKKTFPSKRF